jgi:hypothetical protein
LFLHDKKLIRVVEKIFHSSAPPAVVV